MNKDLHFAIADYAEDEWPDQIDEFKAKPRASGSTSEPGTLKRFADRSRQDLALYKMAALLASVGAGFDIRISNASAIHPQVPGATTNQEIPPVLRKEAFIGQRRDAYFSAIRDSFIEPENTFNGDDDMDGSTRSAIVNNTFHGMTNHYRASIHFEVPNPQTKGPEGDGMGKRADSIGSMTPSSDDNFGATTSASGPSSPYRSSIDDLQCDIGNVSLSMSVESAVGECNPSTGPLPSSNQLNHVQAPFLPHHRSNGAVEMRSAVISGDTDCGGMKNTVLVTQATTPKIMDEQYYKISRPSKSPVRPDTLDVVPIASQTNSVTTRRTAYTSRASSNRYLHNASNNSLSYAGNGSGIISGSSIPSLRSVTSPGSTPPHIDHPRTLLDIDMDGQS